MQRTLAAPLDLKRSAAGLAILCLLLTGLSPATAQQAERFVSVIVQGVSPSAVEKAISGSGGEITRPLEIIGGASATVPQSAVKGLRRAPGIVNVTRDTKVEFQGVFDAVKTAHQIPSVTGSAALWNQGVDGSGATVALIDTGVYDHPDLAGRVTCGIDLSHEAGTEAECADTFGHGTFMAGLIAGNGAASGGKWKGSAPGTNVVSVKVAGYDGSTDVTHILAAIQWVVSFKDIYGIDVLSLSLGTDTAMDYRLNPLNFAVERAWQAGITVVVSAGNRGPGPGTITSPADDPYVITVGASSHQGNVGTNDDTVPVYSGRGPTASNGLAKPDVVSPGTHTVSLRSPGSAIDNMFPRSAVGSGYFKGTGTSMATASVAGQIAQMLQANPGLTPNQVKYRLTETARPIATTDPMSVGHGQVNVVAAATSDLTGEANQNIETSTGLGFVGLTRGSLDVWAETPAGSVQLTGELTAQTNPKAVNVNNPLGLITFDAATYTTGEWDASKWNASKWNTETWAASKWNGAEFEASKWNGSKWNGSKWNNEDWDASKWNGLDWDASKWNASKWNTAWYAVAWD
ncbi:MAG: S8 family peptidase [Actinomycetota bacterium]|nr:S8 family peptidase [Actinomycetota bacterium]